MASLFRFFRRIPESIRERRRQRRLRAETQLDALQNHPPRHQSLSLASYFTTSSDSYREPIASNRRVNSVDLLDPVTCSVCLEEKERSEFPSRKPTNHCDQSLECDKACTPCLANWITNCVDSRRIKVVRCPECGSPFEREDIVEFAPRAVVRR
jgi:hypothetical protein